MPMQDGGKHPGGRKRVPGSVRQLKEAERAELAAMQREARERLLAKAQVALTPEMVMQIVEGIAEGNYAVVVARSLGIPDATYKRWLEDGRKAWEAEEFVSRADPLGLRCELYLLVEQSDAEWERRTVKQMRELIEKGSYWAGHMTLLQRRHPERWDARGRGGSDEELGYEQKLRQWEAERAQQRASASDSSGD